MVGTLWEKCALFRFQLWKSSSVFPHHTYSILSNCWRDSVTSFLPLIFFYNSMPRGKVFLSFDFAKIFLCGKISAVTTPWKNFELSTRISPRNRSHIWTCVSLSHCAVLVSSWILLSPYQQAYVHILSSQNHLSHSLFVSIPGSAVYPTHCMSIPGSAVLCVSRTFSTIQTDQLWENLYLSNRHF